jgi:rubrerythrin
MLAVSGHWSLEDIDWSAFDASRVDVELLKAVKASALVEHNARDYVAYLSKVFADDPKFLNEIQRWGCEEEQHGRALSRWAELADPHFDFNDAFRRFRTGYSLPVEVTESVRGSRAGELLARCVVEGGTSSFYSALKDASDEPVLKEITACIAADEMRHYKLFFNNLERYQAELPHVYDRLRVAVTRFSESSDDELAFAYYCGNADPAKERYRRGHYYRSYSCRAFGCYRFHHTSRLVSMIANAVGFHPRGFLTKVAAYLVFLSFFMRSRVLKFVTA